MKIAIITDSSADLSMLDAQNLGVTVTRMPIQVGSRSFVEAVDITRDEFIDAMKEGAVVKTSQPTPGTLIEAFETLLQTHDHLIFLPISSKLSGTYQTAVALAQDFDGRITIIDSKFVAAPLHYLIRDIQSMIAKGMEPLSIKKCVESEAEMFAPLVPEDIQYLKRGGRISAAAAALANLLKIYPVLLVANGEIDVLEKVRTYKKAVKVAVDSVLDTRNLNTGNRDDYEFGIVDGDCDPKLISKIKKDIELETGRPCKVHKLYPIILAHTGPGSVAVFAYRKLVKE